MTVCEVCGGEEFTEEDGHFYCRICQTQSQDVRVIELDEDDTWAGHSNRITDKSQAGRSKKKQVDDQGRPWSIYELFQIILLEQVEALIKLGAKPELKGFVFKLWANYLSRMGVAFSDGPLLPSLQKYGRQREMFPGTLANTRIKNVLGRKRMKKTGHLTKKAAEAMMERDQMSEALAGETFYEGDNPLEDDGDGEGKVDDDYSTSEEDELELWGSRRKVLKDDKIERMCMAYTLCLCYLGMTYTNPATTLSDILRWVREGTVPYVNVKHLIPSNFKMFLQDWKLLGSGSIPTAKSLRQHTGRMAYFLDLDYFPQVPVCQMISRYILEMNLPAEMHALAINLHKMNRTLTEYIPNRMFKAVPFWEGFAMSHIIVVLKLIFGLNDQSERLFSVYSKELVDLIDHSHELFVWDDWVNHMKERIYTADIPDNTNRPTGSADMVTDVQTKEDNLSSEARRYKLFQPSRRKDIQKPFQELSKRWAASPPGTTETRGDSTFNLMTDDTLDSEDPVGHLLGHYDEYPKNMPSTSQPDKSSEKSRHGFNSGGLSFRKSSLQHLIDPEGYLEDLDRSGLADYTILSSCNDTADSDSDDEEEELGPSPRKKFKQSNADNQSKTSYRKFVFENVQSRPTVTKIKNKKRYDFLMEQVKLIGFNFQISFDYSQMEGKLSFDWLLTICSSILGCDKDHLRDEVRKLEVVSFAEKSDFKRNKQHILKKLKRSRSTHYTKRIKHFY